jgi:hypothetical protein
MTDKAACPVPTVRDVFYNVIGRPENEVDDVCETLGIDPAMPIETLRQRLLWGERVERLETRHVPSRQGGVRQEALVTNSVRNWLTRPDITDSPSP